MGCEIPTGFVASMIIFVFIVPLPVRLSSYEVGTRLHPNRFGKVMMSESGETLVLMAHSLNGLAIMGESVRSMS